MGLEADCQVRFGRKAGRAGRTWMRRSFSFAEPCAHDPAQGREDGRGEEGRAARRLVGRFGGVRARLTGDSGEVGPENPLPEKPDGQAGGEAELAGVGPRRFDEEPSHRPSRAGRDVTEGKASKDSDIIFVAMTKKSDLAQLEALRAAIKPNGAIWVVWPKGRKEFREDDVRAFGPGVGLVDVKVVSVSDTLSGLKMVIPVAQR